MQHSHTTLTIGQLSKLSNISIASIRHYESLGLIEPKTRSASNYRLYGEEQVATLNFILNAKQVGLTLKMIKALVTYSEQKRSGAAFKAKIQDHLDEIQQKIAELKNIEKTVKSLVSSCDGRMAFADCPIVKKLYGKKPT